MGLELNKNSKKRGNKMKLTIEKANEIFKPFNEYGFMNQMMCWDQDWYEDCGPESDHPRSFGFYLESTSMPEIIEGHGFTIRQFQLLCTKTNS
jgi:hypothetical protein